MTNRTFLLNALLVLLPAIGMAQQPEQDCVNALTICQPVATINWGYMGQGFVENEVNVNMSCLGAGEAGAVWFKVKTLTSGILNFTIFPADTLADLDWAVFNLTNANCTQIALNPSLQVGCDFSGTVGVNGATGANNGPNPQDEPVIPVLAGQTYYIVVSNFGESALGFTLDLSASTFGIDNSFAGSFVENFVPQFNPPFNLLIKFEDNIVCSSVDIIDFSLTRADGMQYTIISVTPDLCDGPGYISSHDFLLNIYPQLVPGAEYTLARNGSITNLCNVVSGTTDNVTFIAVPSTVGLAETLAGSITSNTLVIDVLNVNFKLPFSGTLALADLSGRTLHTFTIQNQQQFTFNASVLVQGIYLLTYTNTLGQTYSTKIVKVDN